MADETDFANRPDLRGVEFVPPPERQLASPDQVADFWVARNEWDAQDKAHFVQEQEDLARRNPDRSNREMLLQTERIRSEIRSEIAKEMTPNEIAQRYKDLGQTEHAKEFEQGLRKHEASEDREAIDAFRQKEAVQVLELEDRARSNRRAAPEKGSEGKSGPGDEPPEPTEPQEPPPPGPPEPPQNSARELTFFGDRPSRNFDDLKKEQSEIPTKPESEPGQDKDKEPGKEERTLTFYSYRHPADRSRGR